MTHNVTLCYHKNNNNNNVRQKWLGTDLRPDTLVKGGKKEGNPKCAAFVLICSLIYLEKSYMGSPKKGNRKQTPYIPYSDRGFLSNKYYT